MFNNYVHHGFRQLSEREQASAERAVEWLANKRLKPHEIALLSERNIDRAGKMIEIYVERGQFIIRRRIRYGGSDFESYLTDTLPCLLVQRWIFPSLAWMGKKPTFGFHIRSENVEKYLQRHKKNMLICRKQYSKIEVSASRMHLKTQIMVGRRIALRAET